jgi:TetR/AcrR family transcriptional repressor of nem operon
VTRTGRPREFDEQQALAQARDVFWSQGYEATSVQDLVDALAVQRGSLYAAFGDKRSLYLKAVSLYAQENRAQLEAALQAGPVLPALRRMLAQPGTLTGLPASAGRHGCLIGNTTAQLVPGDEAAYALVASAFDGFIDVVAAALSRGQACGEIATSVAPEVQAQLLLLVFRGSALVSRAASDRMLLIAAIDLTLDTLRPA